MLEIRNLRGIFIFNVLWASALYTSAQIPLYNVGPTRCLVPPHFGRVRYTVHLNTVIQHGTCRTNPVPKPPRTAGEYGMLPMNDTEMHDYGPTGYISGDRYTFQFSEQIITLQAVLWIHSDSLHFKDPDPLHDTDPGGKKFTQK